MLPFNRLSPAQRQRFIDVAIEQDVAIETLLADFCWDPYSDGGILGTLPHCGLFGLMEADGRCHT
jgi:hypothetical protein